MLRITKRRSHDQVRPRTFFFLVVCYLIWASVALRWITEFIEHDHPLTQLVSGLLLLYAVLLGAEPFITRESTPRVHAYLALQTILVMTAILFFYELDFFALLLLPLAGQAVFLLPRRAAGIWIGIFGLANIFGQLQQFGWPEALSFILLYSGGLVFTAAFSILVIQSETARNQSEQYLEELRQAHEELRALSAQTEELAVANERNRLARELHDSVAQTLYGLTLQSEAASRNLKSGKIEVVDGYLHEIRQSARQTLQEIRLLIFELSPPILQKYGLAAALQARLDGVERRSGIKTTIEIHPVERLPLKLETGLYRIAQEALNNALKHAQAGHVAVSLKQEQNRLVLEVMDDGIGFDTGNPDGGIGLQGMQARVQEMDGEFWIESIPGQGTRVRVEVAG